eukprot:jgi/Ulvmu1/2522/UM138_0027.1
MERDSTALYNCTIDDRYESLHQFPYAISEAPFPTQRSHEPHCGHRFLHREAVNPRWRQTRSRLQWIIVWNNTASSVHQWGTAQCSTIYSALLHALITDAASVQMLLWQSLPRAGAGPGR